MKPDGILDMMQAVFPGAKPSYAYQHLPVYKTVKICLGVQMPQGSLAVTDVVDLNEELVASRVRSMILELRRMVTEFA